MNNPLPFVLFGWVFLCGIFVLISWIIAIVRFAKLNNYMIAHHNEVWQELSCGGPFGGVTSNPTLWLPYLFSKTPNEDKQLTELKNRASKSAKYALTFAAIFIVSILIVILVMIFMGH